MTVVEQIAHLADVPMDVDVELDRRMMTMREVLELSAGSVIKMSRSAGENIDIMVGGSLIGFGEIVIIEETVGVESPTSAARNSRESPLSYVDVLQQIAAVCLVIGLAVLAASLAARALGVARFDGGPREAGGWSGAAADAHAAALDLHYSNRWPGTDGRSASGWNDGNERARE
jgi:flagellar motor switch protein FliN